MQLTLFFLYPYSFLFYYYINITLLTIRICPPDLTTGDKFQENNYLTFTTTPTATSLKVMVDLKDEKKAFEVIDAYLQQSKNQ